jgi:Ca2+-binding EF-hand superfamily protein
MTPLLGSFADVGSAKMTRRVMAARDNLNMGFLRFDTCPTLYIESERFFRNLHNIAILTALVGQVKPTQTTGKENPMSIKNTLIAGCTALVIAGAGTAFAAPGQGHRPNKGDLLKKFDADGDGQLSAAERAELHKAKLARFDKDGDGKVSEDERPKGKKGKCRKKKDDSGSDS